VQTKFFSPKRCRKPQKVEKHWGNEIDSQVENWVGLLTCQLVLVASGAVGHDKQLKTHIHFESVHI